MAADDTPIIIKRIKKAAHGHHGGAWKVAYADFVTAMMAFFLLMWLINVTTPAQKMGLAEYFTPTIGVKGSMGIGFKGGKKPSTQVGRSNTDMNAVGLVEGQIAQGQIPQAPEPTLPAKAEEDAENSSAGKNTAGSNAIFGKDNKPSDTSSPAKDSKDTKDNTSAKDNGKDSKNGGNSKEETTSQEDSEDSEQFKMTQDDIKQSLEKDPDMKDYRNNILMQETQEGLKIDMIDDPQKSMFIPGGATLSDVGKKVLDSMANIIVKTPNHIAIIGHTDSGMPSTVANPNYTNWELSSDRANAARRALITTQIEPERVQKVEGLADRDLLTPQEPTSPRNRRITIILMRGSYFRDPKEVPTTRSLLSVQDATLKKPGSKDKKDAPDSAAPKSNAPSMFDEPATPPAAPANEK